MGWIKIWTAVKHDFEAYVHAGRSRVWGWGFIGRGV